MRFLLFNLMVVGALWFLFTDDQGPTAIETMVEDARVQVGSVVAAAEQAIANKDVGSKVTQVLDAVAKTTATEEWKEPEAEVPVAEVPVAEVPVAEVPVAEVPVAEVPVAEVEVAVRAEPIPAIPPASIVPAGMKPLTDPKVIERRDEVMAAGPAAVAGVKPGLATGPTVDPAAMMSPRDRQRELQRLAQDMELLFADKLGQ